MLEAFCCLKFNSAGACADAESNPNFRLSCPQPVPVGLGLLQWQQHIPGECGVRISLHTVPLMISASEDNKEHSCSALHLPSALLLLTN